ncbi:hypothetical protein DFJ73DRAFT_657625 [Zopfochytrium polystomum]|nr:hypothetical protein DFJ73DRAFT_657625 [Zopfochytrium polystomum]
MASIVNSASLNYARWGALVVGVWWGFTKQQSLTRFVKERNEAEEARHNIQLIEEGKVAFEAAYNREQAAKAAKFGIVIDSDSYRFDGEKWMSFAVAETEGESAKVPKK